MPGPLRIPPRMPQAHPARLAGPSDASISAEVTRAHGRQRRAKSPAVQPVRFQKFVRHRKRGSELWYSPGSHFLHDTSHSTRVDLVCLIVNGEQSLDHRGRCIRLHGARACRCSQSPPTAPPVFGGHEHGTSLSFYIIAKARVQ